MRAFIIGNGPSLNRTPLDKLAEEVTFGVNRIHLIYPRVRWRPTHWVLADRSKSLEHVKDAILHLGLGEDCYVREDFANDMLKECNQVWANLTLLPNCDHIDAERNPAAEWHLPRICKFGGSVPVAIQLAAVKGYNPIYLVGCDLGYQGNQVNHFDANYVDVDTRKVPAAMLANHTLKVAHAVARRECKDMGIDIYNATAGGDLTAYPRVKLEELL